MNDEGFCDELLNALEASGERIRNQDGESVDFYAMWKRLDRTIKGLRAFITRKHDRKTAKRILMSAPKINPAQQAQLIGVVRMLPELMRYSTREIGISLNSGRISSLSHNEKREIRELFQSLEESGRRKTDAVEIIFQRRGIARSTIWNILEEDENDPAYWTAEIRRKIISEHYKTTLSPETERSRETPNCKAE
jgi:hypothetical protein